MQCACAILSYMACPALHHFPILSHKRYDFREKNYWMQNVCFGFLYNFCLKHFSIWDEMSEIRQKMHNGHVKCPLLLFDLNETWVFYTVFRKIIKYQTSWKSVQWEQSRSMWTDGRTDMTKLIVAFRNFANAPKEGKTVPLQAKQSQRGWYRGSSAHTETQNWRGVGD